MVRRKHIRLQLWNQRTYLEDFDKSSYLEGFGKSEKRWKKCMYIKADYWEITRFYVEIPLLSYQLLLFLEWSWSSSLWYLEYSIIFPYIFKLLDDNRVEAEKKCDLTAHLLLNVSGQDIFTVWLIIKVFQNILAEFGLFGFAMSTLW